MSNIDEYQDIKNDADELIAKIVIDFDYKKLKLFAVSVLWRAHITKRPEFARVNLGGHAETARQMILRRDPGNRDDFSTIFSCLFSPKFGTNHGWLSPYRERYGPINAYKFHLPGFPVLIKVDSRPFEGDLRFLTIQDGEPLTILVREMESSREFRFLRTQVNHICRAKK